MQIVDLVRRVVHLAELFLDGLHLLIEVVLSLAFFHLLFDATTDPFFNLKKIDFTIHQRLQMLQAAPHIGDLQNALLFLEIDAHVRCNGIGQSTGLIDTR